MNSKIIDFIIFLIFDCDFRVMKPTAILAKSFKMPNLDFGF